MAEIIREGAPRSFVKGETVRWYERHKQFPPSEFPTGTLSLAQANDVQAASSVVDNGDGRFLVTITAAATALFAAGPYYYQFRVTDGTTTHNLATGVIEVLEDLATVGAGHDGRSSAARIYDAVTAVMEGKADHDQASLSIGGKQLTRYNWQDLMEIRGQFAHQMTDDERLARGYMPARPKSVRFTR